MIYYLPNADLQILTDAPLRPLPNFTSFGALVEHLRTFVPAVRRTPLEEGTVPAPGDK